MCLCDKKIIAKVESQVEERKEKKCKKIERLQRKLAEKEKNYTVSGRRLKR